MGLFFFCSNNKYHRLWQNGFTNGSIKGRFCWHPSIMVLVSFRFFFFLFRFDTFRMVIKKNSKRLLIRQSWDGKVAYTMNLIYRPFVASLFSVYFSPFFVSRFRIENGEPISFTKSTIKFRMQWPIKSNRDANSISISATVSFFCTFIVVDEYFIMFSNNKFHFIRWVTEQKKYFSFFPHQLGRLNSQILHF